MRLFECQNCGQPVHFDSLSCLSCGARLGFLPEAMTVSALKPADADGTRQALAAPGRLRRFCANAAHEACSWLVPLEGAGAAEAEAAGGLCLACRHNRIVPDLAVPENLARWRRLELAKRHLLWSLLRWRLPRPDRTADPEAGLAFDFPADTIAPDGTVTPVMTGHAAGVITIAIAEGDNAERERRRHAMGEPYRTLLGHFRHEIGHFYWDQLVAPVPDRLRGFRALFGDERANYAEALWRHYEEGAPGDGRERFISAYAAAHPWEDFAETWAHALHMVDALETAHAFGLKLAPRVRKAADLAGAVDFDPYRTEDVEELVAAWVPVTIAVNEINRSMGQPDLYPFVLSAPAVEKLGYVLKLIHAAGAAGTAAGTAGQGRQRSTERVRRAS